MDEIANILTDIKVILESIDSKLSTLVDSHRCKRCKAIVSNGAIKCFTCDQIDP